MKEKFLQQGFAIANNIYSDEEINNILLAISQVDTSGPTFRRTSDLFAIRQFFVAVPHTLKQIFNEKLKTLISEIAGSDFFVVKSIYFDKPENSNWFVSYHQDLTISVDRKIAADGFGSWTTKQNQWSVQPPLDLLEDNFTIRIHLDKTNEENGALKIIPGSHQKGIYRPETIDWTIESEISCNVEKGGIMCMKPLLLHSSGRSTNKKKRRVIHIEFSRCSLPFNLCWSEYQEVNNLNIPLNVT